MFIAYYIHHLDPFLIEFWKDFGLRWYALAYIAGFVAAIYLLKWLAQKGYGALKPEQVTDFVFYAALLGVLVGGRLGWVLFYRPEIILHDPLQIFVVWEGGMSSHGGIIGLLICTLVYARMNRLSWTGLGDNIVAVAPLGILFGRLANFINGELYGRPTTVPWAVQFPAELHDLPDKAAAAIRACIQLNPALNAEESIIEAARTSPEVREVLSHILTPRHPSQLYEALLEGLLLFVALFAIRLRVRKPDGVVTGCFFLLYPTARIIAEQFREPDAPLTGALTRGQFLSLFMYVVGILFLYFAWRGRSAEGSGFRVQGSAGRKR
jgi:phosphatidylglycerol:prolipoprotein diacylglycerol transferase